jgi:transcriptional regulator with XRE-family HTH domain
MNDRPSRFGVQPAYEHIKPASAGKYGRPAGSGGRIAAIARDLGVNPSTLAGWILGRNTPPAEIKIQLAELLGKSLEECWTPACLNAVYVGPRH